MNTLESLNNIFKNNKSFDRLYSFKDLYKQNIKIRKDINNINSLIKNNIYSSEMYGYLSNISFSTEGQKLDQMKKWFLDLIRKIKEFFVNIGKFIMNFIKKIPEFFKLLLAKITKTPDIEKLKIIKIEKEPEGELKPILPANEDNMVSKAFLSVVEKCIEEINSNIISNLPKTGTIDGKTKIVYKNILPESSIQHGADLYIESLNNGLEYSIYRSKFETVPYKPNALRYLGIENESELQELPNRVKKFDMHLEKINAKVNTIFYTLKTFQKTTDEILKRVYADDSTDPEEIEDKNETITSIQANVKMFTIVGETIQKIVIGKLGKISKNIAYIIKQIN